MKNEYEINGDVTLIKLNSKKHGTMITKIDTDMLEKVNSLPNSWCPKEQHSGFYVVLKEERHDCKRTLKIHRFITDAPDGMVVDHINHDTLDNRRCNLRVVTNQQNIRNMNGASITNNNSKVRGVYALKLKNKTKWTVQLKINGRSTHFGTYETIEEADRVAKEKRKIHYGI